MKTYTLEEIKELEAKATKGPWVSGSQKTTKCLSGEMALVDARGYNIYEKCTAKETEGVAQDNAHFIAVSRTIVPQLVGQLEKAIEALKEVKKQHAPDTLANMIKRKPQCYDLAEQALKELGVE